MVWLNLTIPNETVKNGLNAKKIKLPQMIIFLEKQLLKFPCTYWPLPFCKILKIFLGLIQSYEDVPFLGPKWPICHDQKFFGTNHYYYFHLPIALLIVQNLKKFLQQIQSYQDVPFLGKKWSICPKQNFFWKIIMTLIYLLVPFIVQNFEKPLPADSEFWGCAIFGPKRAHFPKWEFFSQKTLEWALFLSLMHIYRPKIKVRY